MSNQESSPYQKRRRFGIGTAITTALAAYGTYHLALWAWNAWSTVDDKDDGKKKTSAHQGYSSNRMRQRQMLRCRREIAITLSSLVGILQRKIDESTDVAVYRSQLKEIRKLQSHNTKHQEEVLWMKIQVETVNRLMTNVYAYTLLFTALTIQVNFLASLMYRNQETDDTKGAGVNEHNALLLSYDAFFERGGLDDLLTCIREATMESLKDWSIQDPSALHMTATRLQQAISQIRSTIEVGNLLQKFVVMENYESLIDNVELLNEMYDLFESPVANDATNECLNCVFAALELHHIEHIFATPTADIPLARVVTQLKATTSSFFKTDALILSMEKLPAVQEAAITSYGT